jgi:FkbM family methyltransferase
MRIRLYGLAVVLKEQLYWKPTRRRFYSQFVKKGDLCFDIGANLGTRTEAFRKLGATTIAVEPQDVCVASLKKRWGKDKKVRIVQKAVGAQEGEITLAICTKDNEKSSCSAEWMGISQNGSLKGLVWDMRVRVQMTTLDKLIEEFGIPTFCKIDTEGFEWECIQGLSQPIKALSLEFLTEHVFPAINSIHRLAELGLTKYNYSIAESMELALNGWTGADEICKILENYPDRYTYGDVYATTA